MRLSSSSSKSDDSISTAPPLAPTEDSKSIVDGRGTTTLSDIHPDILQLHILSRLDGPTLASASCTSSQFRALSSHEDLWSDLCRSTWPSVGAPLVHRVISRFPDGHRSFFADSCPLLLTRTNARSSPWTSTFHSPPLDRHPPSKLISAVDIHHCGNLIFSRVVETETVSGWFRCSPFRIDMLDPKEVVAIPVPFLDSEYTCCCLGNDLRLSWILIDPNGGRAMNLSSVEPVSTQRHWLSGEVQVRFASVLVGYQRGSPAEHVQVGIGVTCRGPLQGGELKVGEVSMQVEDMEGAHLSGKDSLVILQRAFGDKRRRRGRYEEFLERKRERKERKRSVERTLDALCVAVGVVGLFVFWFSVLS